MKYFKYFLLISCLMVTGAVMLKSKSTSATCPNSLTNRGTATQMITVPTTATYRVWSRIMATNPTNNSYILEIDSTTCGVVVGDLGSLPVNTWTWVDYQDGASANKINVTLTAGTHTLKMVGREDNVKLDRIILTTDTTCVPSVKGDNCASPPDTTPPVVSLTAPIANASVYGNVSVAANATDDVAIAKVEFYADGILKNTDLSPAYGYTLDTSQLSIGNHKLTAKAYDTAGIMTSSGDVVINVVSPPDTIKPVVAITLPNNGQTVSGTTTLVATATDNIGITKVEFLVDGQIFATDTIAPFNTSLATSSLADGSHKILAKAYDAAGNSTTSTENTVIVSNPVTPPPVDAPPTISISNPINTTLVKGAVVVSALATDDRGVARVEFYVDEKLRFSDTSSPYDFTLDTTSLTNGLHSIRVVAYDSASKSAADSLAVTVNNLAVLATDIDKDGDVDGRDYYLLVRDYGNSGAGLGRADIDKDGDVDGRDYYLLVRDYGSGL